MPTKKTSIPYKNILPWIIAAVIFYFLFRKYPLEQILQAARGVHGFFFISYILIYLSVFWFFDCWSLSRILSRFGIPTTIREILPIEFASSLFTMNYLLSQGVFAYFLKNSKKITFSKSASIVLFILVLDIYLTFTFAAIGSVLSHDLLSPMPWTRFLPILWGVITLISLTGIFFWKLPSLPAGFSDYGVSLLTRIPQYIVGSTAFYFVALTFGVKIPLFVVMAFSPIIGLIRAIPLTPGGLGTTQVAMVIFFKNYINLEDLLQKNMTASEMLISMSLCTTFTCYFLNSLFGAFFLKKAMFPSNKPVGLEDRTC